MEHLMTKKVNLHIISVQRIMEIDEFKYPAKLAKMEVKS